MDRTHIVFVQLLKVLDVRSALTPSTLTFTHWCWNNQSGVSNKDTKDKASGAILGFIIFLRDTSTIHVVCKDLGSNQCVPRATTLLPDLQLHLNIVAQKRLYWKVHPVVAPTHRLTGDCQSQTMLCLVPVASIDGCTENPAYAVWLPSLTWTLTCHQRCRSTFWAEMTDDIKATSQEKLIAPHRPNRALRSQGAGLFVLPRSLKLEWMERLQPSGPPAGTSSHSAFKVNLKTLYFEKGSSQRFHTCTHWELAATEAVEHFQSTAELPLSKALPPKLSKTGRFSSV